MQKKKYKLSELLLISNEVRQDVVKMIAKAGSGHPAGSLGSVELFVSLYLVLLNHDPQNPCWEERDRLILSCGHICPARYAVMARLGYFPKTKLFSLGRFGGILQGHPDRRFLPAVETTSGPLGCGLGQAAGIAYAARMDGAHFRTFCITSDGEHNEGAHWEAVMFAAKNKLSNLTLFVDRNNIQIDGTTEEVMPLEPLIDKYKAFGWNAISIDGHNIPDILTAVGNARSESAKPTVIVANTIPGKGVDFMQKNPLWHAKAPSLAEERDALKQLKEEFKKLTVK